MKTTIDLPDATMRRVKIRAAETDRNLKDVMAELITRGLAQAADTPLQPNDPAHYLGACPRYRSQQEVTEAMRLEELLTGGVYLDSNALIFAVEAERGVHPDSVAALFREIEAGRIQAFVSALVRGEVLVLPLRIGDRHLADLYREFCSESGPFTPIALEDRVADRAAEMRAHNAGLKLVDAWPAATAIHAGCRALLSADKTLKKMVGDQIEVLAFDEITI